MMQRERWFILALILMSCDLTQSLTSTTTCSTDGDVRLEGGRNQMEGRVEVCLNGCWSGVCYNSSWGNGEDRALCRQLGYLEYYILRVSERSGVSAQSRIVMYDVQCLAFEERLIYCGHQISSGNHDCDNVRTRCVEGVPPQNLQLHSNNLTLTWSPPNANNRSLTHTGYTVTCSTVSLSNKHTSRMTIPKTMKSVAIADLALTEFDYNCCVAADYGSYHPMVCVNVNHTAPITTDGASVNYNTFSTVSSTLASTDLPVSVSSTSITDVSPLPAVGGALLGTAVLLVLASCVGITVYHMKLKANSKRMYEGSSVVDNPVYRLTLQDDSQQHAYEEVNLNTCPTKSNDTSLSRECPETHTTEDGALGHPECTPVHHQQRAGGATSTDYGSEHQMLAKEKMKKQWANGHYEFSEVPVTQHHMHASPSIEKLSPTLANEQLQMSDHYEFAEIASEQNAPSRYDASSGEESSAETERKGLNLCACDDIGSIESEDNDRTEYVNVHTDNHEEEPECHHTYSRMDLTDAPNRDHTYSHINTAEMDKKQTYMHSSHANLTTEDSHNYSHVNPHSGKLLSPGYFHLDTAKPGSVSGKTLVVQRNTPYSMRRTPDNSVGLNDGKRSGAKGYSHLEIDVNEVAHLSEATGNSINVKGYSQLEITAEDGPLEKGVQNKLSDFAISKGYSHLDMEEIEVMQEDSRHEASKGYSHLDISETKRCGQL